MKNIILIFSLLLFLIGSNLFADVKTSTGSGFWNDVNSWSPAGVPTSSDNVTITSTHNITLNVNASCLDLTVNGTLTNTTFTLAIAGNLTVNSGATYTSGTGMHTLNGTGKVIGGTIATLSITNLTISGTIANDIATLTAGTLVTVSGTLTNNASKTVTATTALSGNGSFIQSLNSVLNIGGASTINTIDASVSPNTVFYTSASSQNIKNITFHHLTLTGAGIKTLVGNVVVSGDLTVSDGYLQPSIYNLSVVGNSYIAGIVTDNSLTGTNTFSNVSMTGGTITSNVGASYSINGTLIASTDNGTIGAAAITVTETTTVSANRTLTINSATGAKTFGDVVIDGNWTNSGNSAITISGNLTVNSGATFTSGSGVYTLSGTSTSITGTIAALSISSISATGTITNNIPALTVGSLLSVTSPGTFTNYTSKTVTATAALSGTGSFIQSANSVLNIGGASAINSIDAVASPNVVNYTSAGGQSIKNITFHHLTLTGAGLKTLTGAVVVNGDLTVSEGTLNPSTFDLTVSGSTYIAGSIYDYSQTGTNTFTNVSITGGTITSNVNASYLINGTLSASTDNGTIGAATITVVGATSVSTNRTLTINSATGIKTFGDIVIDGNWTNSGNSAITISGDLTVNENAVFTSGTGAYTFSGATKLITGTIATLSIASVSATGSVSNNITALTVGTLLSATTPGTFTNNASKTVTAATALSGTGSFIQSTNSILNIGGTSTISTIDAATNPNTINYTSSTGVQTIKATTYHHLVINKSGQVATVATPGITVNGDLTVSAGTLADGGFTITGSGTGTFTLAASASYTTTRTAAPWFPTLMTIADLPSSSTVSYNGNGNFTLPATPATFGNLLIGVGGTKTLSAPISVNINLTISAGTLACSIYQITGNSTGTLTMTGTAGLSLGLTTDATAVAFPLNYTNISLAPTTTVTYQANGAQTISSVPTYGNLALSTGAAAVIKTQSASTLNVAGSFAINTRVTLSTDASTINITGNLSGAGILSFTTGALNIGGNNTIGTFNCGTGTVTYNGAGNQTIRGTTYNNLTINKTTGTSTLGAATIVNGILSMNKSITLSASNLTMGASSSFSGSFSASNMILTNGVGSLKKQGTINADFVRTYPIGTGTTYTPFDISAINATYSGQATISMQSQGIQHPLTTGTNNCLLRYWKITPVNIALTTGVTGTLTYVDPTDIGAATETNLTTVGCFVGSTWNTTVTGASVAPAANTIILNNSTQLDGEWTAGEPGAFAATTSKYTIANGAWNTSGTWYGGIVPNAVDKDVIIRHAVTAPTTPIDVRDLTISSGASLALGDQNFTVAGVTTNSGTLTEGSNTGVTTFTGLVTNNSGATFTSTLVTAVGNIIFQGGIANSGTFSAASVQFTTNNQNISGNSAMSFAATGKVEIAGAIQVTNQNTSTVTISGVLDGTDVSSEWINDANATLTWAYAGATAQPMNTGELTASANGNTVIYSGNAVENIKTPTTSYYNLTCSSNTKIVQSNVVVSNNLIVSAGTLDLGTAATSFSVGGTATITGILLFNGTETKTVTISGNLNGAGTINMSGGNLLHNLNLGGTTNAITTFTTAAVASTVNYNSAGAQQVFGSANYRNLVISGGSIKSLTGATTVNENLNVLAGTIQLGAQNFTVTGTSTITGAIDDNSTTGTNTLGDVIVGGSWTSTGGESYTISGNLTVSDVASFSSGTGVYTFTGASKTIGGLAATLSISNLTVTGTVFNNIATLTTGTLTVTAPGTLTNNTTKTITASTALSGTGSFIQSLNAILNIGGTIGITTIDAATNINTVNYNSSTAAQTIKATTYHHLVINKSGQIATIATPGITVNGDLSVSNGTLADGGFAITGTGAGTFTVAAGASYTTTRTASPWFPTLMTLAVLPATSTVSFNGNGTFTIPAAPAIYGNLLIGVGGVKTLSSNIAINGNLTISAGTLACDKFQITGNASGTISMTGTAILILGSTTDATNVLFPTLFTNISLAATTAVTYQTNGAQTISTLPTYGSLTISSGVAAIKTLTSSPLNVANLIVNTNVTLPAAAAILNITGNVSGAAIISFTSGEMNIGGNNTTSGTFTCGSGTVTYNGSGNQTIRGTTYNNLTINKATGTATLGAATIVNGVLSMNNSITLSSSNLTMGATSSFVGTFSASNMIITNSTGSLIKQGTANADFVRTFPIGTGTTYTPFAISAISASYTGTATLTIQSQGIKHALTTGSNNSLLRYWKITPANITLTNVSGTLIYVDPTDVGAGTETGFTNVGRYVNPTWNTADFGISIDHATNTILLNNATQLNGEWTAGEPGAFGPTTSISTIATGAWNTAGIWSGGVVPNVNNLDVIIRHNVTAPTTAIDVRDLTISTGVTLTLNTQNFTVAGVTNNSGTITESHNSGITTFVGLVTNNSGATFTSTNVINTGNLVFKGGIANSGTFNAASAQFAINNQSLSGASAMNFTAAGNVQISGAIQVTNQNTNTVTIAGTLDGTDTNSEWINDANSTLLWTYAGATTQPMNTGKLTASASGNTINYNGNAIENIKTPTTNYFNLTCSANTKTVLGNVTVSNNFNLSAGTLDLGTAATSFSVGGTAAIAGVFLFNGTTTKTVSIAGNLSGAGTINMSGGNLLHTLNLGGATNAITTFTTAAVASTVNYNRIGIQQIISSANYRNLTISGGDIKSLAGATTVTGNLDISAGTLQLGAQNFTVTGTTTVTGTIDDNSTTGTNTLGDVVVNGTWTSTGGESYTISGNLTVNTGATFTSGNGIYTLSGASKSIAGNTISATNVTISGTYTYNCTNVSTFNNLNLNSASAQLIIANLKALTVDVSLTNSGTILVDGYTNGNSGSLITPATITNAATGICSFKTSIKKNYWHGVSSPVKNPTIGSVFNDVGVNSFSYNELAQAQDYWVSAPSNTIMSPSTGYYIYYGANKLKTYTSSGTGNGFNSAPQTKNVTYNSPGRAGWNFLGNPFPSSIDWNNAAITLTNVGTAYYVRNGSAWEPYIRNAELPLNGNYIYPGQGFFVIANAGGGSVSIGNAAKAHYAAGSLKSTQNEKKLQDPILQLSVQNDSAKNSTYVRFIDGASTAFDNEFDGYKIFSDNAAFPEIYSLSTNSDSLSFNSYPSLNSNYVIPIGLKIGVAGTYTIEADHILNFDDTLTVYLKDNLTGVFINLRHDSLYTFSTGFMNNATRFSLQFSMNSPTDVQHFPTLSENKFNVTEPFFIGNELFFDVFNSSEVKLNTEIYDITGKLIYSELHNMNNQVLSCKLFMPQLSAGIYFVKVNNGDNKITKKFAVIGK